MITVYRLLANTQVTGQTRSLLLRRWSFNVHSLKIFEQKLTQGKEQLAVAGRMMGELLAETEQNKQEIQKMQINLTELARKHPLEFEILEKNLILEESVRRTKKENDEMLARIRKDLNTNSKYSIVKIAKDVIELADSLAKARLTAEKLQSDDLGLSEIIQCEKALHQLFQNYEITQFDPQGELFDPNLHESMGKILTQNNSKDNYVAQTLRRGYLIGDRLLRSAYVTIYSSEG